MRVLVMRAKADAERTAAALKALGHDAVLAPVLRIVPRQAPVPTARFEAVLATSAHAFVGGQEAVEALHRLPLFAVGAATAEAGRRAGFKDVRVSLGDASALATLVTLTLPRPAHLIVLAGRDRKPGLEDALSQAGYGLTFVEAYVAEAEQCWPAVAIEVLPRGDIAAAVHFSRRSAALALGLAKRHGLALPFLALSHLCLSKDVAVPLREAGAERVLVAAEPCEAALLKRLADVTA